MELYKELIAKQIGEIMLNTLGNAQIDYAAIVADKSYQALLQIKAVISDDSLEDFDCVDKIVLILEEFGSSGGARHDF